MKPVRVLLADDHPITREGTRHDLEREADIEVIDEAKNGEEAMRLTRDLRPDALLLDIGLPKLNGIQVAQAVREIAPETHVVVLTGYENQQYTRTLARLGTSGYLARTGAAPYRPQISTGRGAPHAPRGTAISSRTRV